MTTGTFSTSSEVSISLQLGFLEKRCIITRKFDNWDKFRFPVKARVIKCMIELFRMLMSRVFLKVFRPTSHSQPDCRVWQTHTPHFYLQMVLHTLKWAWHDFERHNMVWFKCLIWFHGKTFPVILIIVMKRLFYSLIPQHKIQKTVKRVLLCKSTSQVLT